MSDTNNKPKIQCKICGQQTNLVIDSFSRYHIKQNHPEIKNIKEYYDLYIRKNDEGKCLECGKETQFEGYNRGYRKFCSYKCSRSSKYVAEKISNACENRDWKGVKQKCKETCLERYGTISYNGSIEGKEQIRKTNLEKYGTTNTLQLEHVKEARNKALLDPNVNEKRRAYWTKEKIEKVNAIRNKNNLEKYGIENLFSTNLVRDKAKKTIMERYGVEYATQSNIIKEKTRQTNKEKYGVDYISQSQEFKDKIIKTSLEKFSSSHYLSSNIRRKQMENEGRWRKKEEFDLFEAYCLEVDKETKIHIEELFSSWDGKCYYTGSYLCFKQNDPLQVTIDHKISKSYGFDNKIMPQEIGNIKNLCLCSRRVNTQKNFLTEQQFVDKVRNGEIII